MNLIDGQYAGSAAAQLALDSLEQRIAATLSRERLDPELVITACDRLARELDTEELLAAMQLLGIDRKLGLAYLQQARLMFSGDYLRHRLRTELGDNWGQPQDLTPLGGQGRVREELLPLGVLLHIAAGNVDGLPAFSVAEGLLTGNINLLKLPEDEGGATLRLLSELISLEPRLAEYIYVFDYSSKDVRSISKLVAAADAVVVWGGDGAVTALRKMTPPETRLIEWGHKLSFAYVTPSGATDAALAALARNICHTDQLLCSSCQGLFLDSEDMADVKALGERFLPMLEAAAREAGLHREIGLLAQTSLELYNAELESLYDHSRVLRGQGVSVIVSQQRELSLSLQFRNCWLRPLPRTELLTRLRPHKNHLQTAALLCAEDERAELAALLSRTGLTRLTDGDSMSASYCGAAHDGEYPLRRYMKVFSQESGL